MSWIPGFETVWPSPASSRSLGGTSLSLANFGPLRAGLDITVRCGQRGSVEDNSYLIDTKEDTINRSFLNTARKMIQGVILLFAILLAGCSGSDRPAADKAALQELSDPCSSERLKFVDATNTSRIRFTYRSGTNSAHAPILYEMGGGCGLFDLDGDGCLDTFFTGGGYLTESGPQPFPNGCFQNLGDGTFRDVSGPSGLSVGRHYSMGVSAADYDADGLPDVLVTGYGGLQLFHNQGDGTFSEQANTAGLADKLWSTSAAWGDVNGDGYLDLYVCHYVDWSPVNDPVCHGPTATSLESCPPGQFNGLPHALFLSEGTGEFKDISKVAGLRRDGKGLGVVMADLDADGDLDIYVANDAVDNFLYRNDGLDAAGYPHFAEIGTESGAALSDSGTADGSMGLAVLDLNQDSRPDLWVSNFEYETPGLYRNEGGANFTHIARLAGLASRSNSFVSFGTVAADFDGDRDDDVFVTNGHVARYPASGAVLQPCQLFENLGGSVFRDVSKRSGECLSDLYFGRGLAVGDIDGDGDPDTLLSPKDGPARVFKNAQASVAVWLSVQLTGVTSPRDGKGAVVTLVRGEKRTTRWNYGGESYLSSSSTRLCFPDDQPTETVELEITWPSGRTQRLKRLKGTGEQEWVADCGICRRAKTGLYVLEPSLNKREK